MTPSRLIAALKSRYATKVFDSSRTIPADVWNALEESLVLTPSSFGLQPWKFIVITDKALRERLLPNSWNQKQVVDCSHFVVFARLDNIGPDHIAEYVHEIAETRGVAPATLGGYQSMMEGFINAHPDIDRWAGNQVYIALGQFMAACALLEVDACPMEGINPAKYDEILGLQGKGFSTIVACAAGYRSQDDKYAHAAKVRKASGKVIDRR